MGKLRQARDVLMCAGAFISGKLLAWSSLSQPGWPVVLTPRPRIPWAWGVACTCCPGAEGPWTHGLGAEWPRGRVRLGSRLPAMPSFLRTTQRGTPEAHLPQPRQHHRHRECRAQSRAQQTCHLGPHPRPSCHRPLPAAFQGGDGPKSPHCGGLCGARAGPWGWSSGRALLRVYFRDVSCESGKRLSPETSAGNGGLLKGIGARQSRDRTGRPFPSAEAGDEEESGKDTARTDQSCHRRDRDLQGTGGGGVQGSGRSAPDPPAGSPAGAEPLGAPCSWAGEGS